MSKRPNWWLWVLAKIWPITWISAKATRWPLVGRVVKFFALPLFSNKNLNITYIPINEGVSGSVGTYLPREIVSELIRRSSHRAIINRCTCRDARSCENHPIDYGCTLLGEGTKEIDQRIARHVTTDEAIQHLDKTIKDGLIPMIGRVKLDNYIWGVRDRGRLLTICHCCRCCCTIMASGKYLPREAADSLVPLEGLTFTTDQDACTLCGACVEECFMGAIYIKDGRLERDENLCKGCGRCITVCPQGANRAEIKDLDATIDELMGRIRERVDIE